MKRDMDLVRKLLLSIEASDQPHVSLMLDSVEGYSYDMVYYHLNLMEQGNLLGKIDLVDGEALILGMSWAGHDFLDAARSDTNWDKAKQATKSAGGWTFDLFKQVLVSIASQTISKSLGLPPG